VRFPKLLALEHRPHRRIECHRVDAHHLDALIDQPVRGLPGHTHVIGEVCVAILDRARAGMDKDDIQGLERIADGAELEGELKDALTRLLAPLEKPLARERPKPFVILLAGVNGAGKTTTIAKLTRLFQAEGRSVLLAAGDTFRAAAREQLAEWGRRHDVTVISQDKGDSAAVIFDAIQSARARGIDVVMADTAGRLPTQAHLMEEIRKVKRVITKADAAAPHETWLVLDANTGQNAVRQVQAFDKALGLTGLIVTKLDGTAKGGAVAGIAMEHPVPILFIGIGEKPEDLRPFVAAEFVEALFT